MSPRERALEQYTFLKDNPTPDGDTIDLARVAQDKDAEKRANEEDKFDDNIRWRDIAKIFLKAGVRYAVNYGQKLYLMTKEGMQKLSQETRHDSEMHYWANTGCHELHDTPSGLKGLAHRFMRASKAAVFAFQKAFKKSTVQPAYFSEAVPPDLVVDARNQESPQMMTQADKTGVVPTDNMPTDDKNNQQYPPMHVVQSGEKPIPKAETINRDENSKDEPAPEEVQASKANAPLQPDQDSDSQRKLKDYWKKVADGQYPSKARQNELVKKISDSLGTIGKIMGVKYIIANGHDSSDFNITIDDGGGKPTSFNLDKTMADNLFASNASDPKEQQRQYNNFHRGVIERTAYQLDKTLGDPMTSKEDKSKALSKLNAGESNFGHVFDRIMQHKQSNFNKGIDMTSEMVPSSTVVTYTQDDKTGMYKPITSGDVRESMEDALQEYKMDDLTGQAREEAKTILGNDYLDDAYKKAQVHEVRKDDKIKLDKSKQAEIRYYATSQDMRNENRVNAFVKHNSNVKDNSIVLMQPNNQTGKLVYFTVGDVKTAADKDLKQIGFDPNNELAPNQKQAARDVLVQNFAKYLQGTVQGENNMKINLPLDQMMQTVNQEVIDNYAGDSDIARKNRDRLQQIADSVEPMTDNTLKETTGKPNIPDDKQDSTLQKQGDTALNKGEDNSIQQQASQPENKPSEPVKTNEKPSKTDSKDDQPTNNKSLKQNDEPKTPDDTSLRDDSQPDTPITADDPSAGYVVDDSAPVMFDDDPEFN